MIYLITGLPGSGKTLHMVSMLANREDLKNRPLYIDGIPELDAEKIPHNALPENCSGANWHEWLPTGAVLVIDECQRYWRPRANGSQIPEAVKQMETHRHKGVDIFLLTQHPRLLDINVRSFIENHKHISKSQLGVRRIFEWQRAGNPESKSDVNSAIVKPYALDKSAFNLYKSSELHTKLKTNRSIVFYLLPLFLLLGFVLVGYSLTTLFSDDNPFKEKQKQQQTVKQKEAQSNSQSSQINNNNNNENKGLIDNMKDNMNNTIDKSRQDERNANKQNNNNNINDNNNKDNDGDGNSKQRNDNALTEADFEPTIKGQPWTAPAYQHLSGKNQIKSMPFPSFCIKDKKTCNCYTDQATLIEEMSQKACRDIMRKGLYNPYKTAEQIYKQHDGGYSDGNNSSNQQAMSEATKAVESNGFITKTMVLGTEEAKVNEAEQLSKNAFNEME